MKRLLDYDPASGISEIFHYDNLTGDVHIETRQDVQWALDRNQALRNDEEFSKNGIKNSMWNYAFIPDIVQLKWINQYGIKNDPMLKENKALLFKLLNSPEWAYLKTTNKIHLAK